MNPWVPKTIKHIATVLSSFYLVCSDPNIKAVDSIVSVAAKMNPSTMLFTREKTRALLYDSCLVDALRCRMMDISTELL